MVMSDAKLLWACCVHLFFGVMLGMAATGGAILSSIDRSLGLNNSDILTSDPLREVARVGTPCNKVVSRYGTRSTSTDSASRSSILPSECRRIQDEDIAHRPIRVHGVSAKQDDFGS